MGAAKKDENECSSDEPEIDEFANPNFDIDKYLERESNKDIHESSTTTTSTSTAPQSTQQFPPSQQSHFQIPMQMQPTQQMQPMQRMQPMQPIQPMQPMQYNQYGMPMPMHMPMNYRMATFFYKNTPIRALHVQNETHDKGTDRGMYKKIPICLIPCNIQWECLWV